MPPARHKLLDDSRSEASSIITNLKDKASNNMSASTVTGKGKKNTSNLATDTTSITKTAGAAQHTTAPESDPNQPKTNWSTFSASDLHSYRTAYRLATASSYTHPHADILYKSSPLALRAPSAVQARRRHRDLKHQRRKSITEKNSRTNGNGRGRKAIAHSIEQEHGSSSSPVDHVSRQEPEMLATAVRKHFNAQQMNEGETIAKFTYVVRHSGSIQARGTQVEGGVGDGTGYWMGSQGRRTRRSGGETGFRLRFRPS